MKKEIKKGTVVIALTIIILIQVLARIYVGKEKEYFHIDEAYSYSLMNYNKIQITENDDFFDNWHDKNYYIDYLAVNENEKFDFNPVYINQKNDVHPPLYYLLLRIAASFTIDNFTKWTGIILNIIIYVFSSIFIYLISDILLKNKKKALFITLIAGLTLGALDTTAYIRMYELANLFILMITYMHMKIYDKEELKVKDLITIGVIALLGSLTHYYIIIYIAILFLIFVIKYIKKKQYKNLARYIATFAIAAILSLIIFPYSMYHMFGGYRGEGAKNSLLNIDSFFVEIAQCFYILQKGVTNNLSILLILIFIIFKQKSKNEIESADKQASLIFIPTLVYFILVAKMSPYKELRYFMPIISVSTVLVMYYFYLLYEGALKGKKAIIAMVVTFVILVISPLVTNANLEFTYKKMNHLAERIEEKSDLPAIYLFNENNIRFLDDIYIFTKIENSYIMKNSNANINNVERVLEGKDTSNGMIIVYNEGVEPEEIIKQIKDKYNYTEEEIMQNLNAGQVVYIH